MATRQVQPDAREQFADAAPDLEQAQPQGVELHERVPPGHRASAAGYQAASTPRRAGTGETGWPRSDSHSGDRPGTPASSL